jgi:T5SS/PEP-CTERM-associated repeat protein
MPLATVNVGMSNINTDGSGGEGTCTVTVDGAGSTWNVGASLSIGFTGKGGTGKSTMSITHGGTVTCGAGYIDSNSNNVGVVTVDGAGSSLTSGGTYEIGAGGNGTLTIQNKGTVQTASCIVGRDAGSRGIVNVDGAGSTWNSSDPILYIGSGGSGSVNITSGGKVYVGNAFVAGSLHVSNGGALIIKGGSANSLNLGGGGVYVTTGGSVNVSGDILFAGGLPVMVVDGAHSTVTAGGAISVSGSAKVNVLMIQNGGSVTGTSATIGSAVLEMSVGDGSLLTVGSGSMTNNSVLCLVASPGFVSGTRTPIIAGTWAGTGSVTSYGGTWSATSHTFTASTRSGANAGSPVTVDCLQVQRVRVTEPVAGGTLDACFPATTSNSNVTFVGLTLTPAQRAQLQGNVPAGGGILSGWTFTATNYQYSSMYLSLSLGRGYTADNLKLWSYTGSSWTAYSPADFSFDGTYASFSGGSPYTGFAVTTDVLAPEPASLGVLAGGAAMVLVRRRRRRF